MAKLAKLHLHVPAGLEKQEALRIKDEAEEAAKQAGEGPRILDLASGPGEPGTLLAQQHPEATVTLSDVAPDMVAMARDHIAAARVTNATAIQMDAHDLSSIPDASIDLVTSCYGLMFFEAPERALTEVERVLKPGGQLIAAVWLDMPWLNINARIMQEVLGADEPVPSEMATAAMSMAEQGLLEGMVERSGEMQVYSTIESTYPFVFGGEPDDGPDVAFQMCTMPIRKALEELVASGEQPDALKVARQSFDAQIAEGKHAKLDDMLDWSSRADAVVTRANKFKVVAAHKLRDDDWEYVVPGGELTEEEMRDPEYKKTPGWGHVASAY